MKSCHYFDEYFTRGTHWHKALPKWIIPCFKLTHFQWALLLGLKNKTVPHFPKTTIQNKLSHCLKFHNENPKKIFPVPYLEKYHVKPKNKSIHQPVRVILLKNDIHIQCHSDQPLIIKEKSYAKYQQSTKVHFNQSSDNNQIENLHMIFSVCVFCQYL